MKYSKEDWKMYDKQDFEKIKFLLSLDDQLLIQTLIKDKELLDTISDTDAWQCASLKLSIPRLGNRLGDHLLKAANTNNVKEVREILEGFIDNYDFFSSK